MFASQSNSIDGVEHARGGRELFGTADSDHVAKEGAKSQQGTHEKATARACTVQNAPRAIGTARRGLAIPIAGQHQAISDLQENYQDPNGSQYY